MHILLTSILRMYLRCFTLYTIDNICTKGSQSRERLVALLANDGASSKPSPFHTLIVLGEKQLSMAY